MRSDECPGRDRSAVLLPECGRLLKENDVAWLRRHFLFRNSDRIEPLTLNRLFEVRMIAVTMALRVDSVACRFNDDLLFPLSNATN